MNATFEAGRLADVLEAQRAEFAAVEDALDAEHFEGMPLNATPLPEVSPLVGLRLVQLVPVASPFSSTCAVRTLRNAAGMLDESVTLMAVYPPHRSDIIAYKAAASSNAKALRRVADQLEAKPCPQR